MSQKLNMREITVTRKIEQWENRLFRVTLQMLSGSQKFNSLERFLACKPVPKVINLSSHMSVGRDVKKTLSLLSSSFSQLALLCFLNSFICY